MALLKWKKDDKNWFTFYADALLNRLRKDKNLGDLTDKAAARENLELIGDVSTAKDAHNHDNRYLSAIEQERNERKAFEDQISKIIDGEITTRQESLVTINNAITEQQKNIDSSLSSLKQNVNDTNEKISTGVDTATQASNLDTKTTTIPGIGDWIKNVHESTWRSIADSGQSGLNCPGRGGPTVDGRTYWNFTTTTNAAIPSGTYTVTDLLNKLVSAAHTHTFSRSGPTNCDCNCFSNCDCSNCGSSH